MSPSLPPDARLGRYEIRSQLGVGGMGEVYLAHDTRLDRKVALKVLPVDVASNRDRMERFIREAKSAAGLSHPNIAQIFEIGEADGTHFISMEFVEGVTLREKIHREQTELTKLLRYLQHVAEGLSKAHAAGIVHRDLKPDNIMITREGHAKILDFGLAKLIEPQQPPDINSGSGSEDATTILQQQSMPGVIMGTVGYMSPEQAQGKTNEIDQRSDIFSFGCILYEAATGHKAFAGKDVVDSLNKIIREPVAPISDFRPDTPNTLQRIVRRCLAKDPEDRYQTIKEVAIELRELRHELAADGALDVTVTPTTVSNATGAAGARGAVSQTEGDSARGSEPGLSSRASSAEYVISGFKQHKLAAVIALLVLVVGGIALGLYLHARNTEVAIESIAVLPFENQNRDPNTDYLSDGITESIINSLTQLPNLRVIARSSVFRYKGKETDPLAVGKELDVRAVLVGRIMQRGDNLTISAELVDVRDNKQLWGEQYERKASELMSLQRDIAGQIANNLRVKISGEVHNRMMKHYTENPEAYQLYLKGRFYWNRRTGESLKQAVEFYRQALEKDPNYALAYSGLAETYVLFPPYSVALPQESYPQAKAAALRALEIDDSLAEAHAALGLYLTIFERNRSGAERELRRAIELNPNYATAHHWLGLEILAPTKRFDEALVEMKRAEELDPLSSIIVTEVGGCLLLARRYDEAIAQFKHGLSLDPKFYYAHVYLGWGFNAMGRYREAIDEYRKALELNDDPTAKAFLALSLAKSGQRGEAIKLRDQLNLESPHRYVSSYCFAILHLALGEKDEAFAWLEKDIAERSSWTVLYAVEPELDELRDDPRFKDMLKRLNLPE